MKILKYLFLSQLLLVAGCASPGNYVSNYVDENLAAEKRVGDLKVYDFSNDVKRSLPINPTTLLLLSK
ncbi:hypothetical protein [Bartonella tribocorum]|uniref:Lipoprotein n=1 Tax=Bartonella tribocorum (strain DSM 28219 / CCUG 45778 / CIP 105476 / IBS 506) TaxID=382640 RepID=A9IYM6_BART1|nr:hypothetical protein predicted by Glimmer/Critica [Bartonella tribocorum CIP 105476]CDO49730.1 hypothetical protein BM1374166_02087 [Bartonella tribocorum]